MKIEIYITDEELNYIIIFNIIYRRDNIGKV